MARRQRAVNADTPKITSISSQFTRELRPLTGTKAATDEQTVDRKKKALDIVDLMLDNISDGIKSGKIELTNSADVERTVKMLLILSGEPETITGNGATSETVTDEQKTLEATMSRANELLTLDDENVKGIFDKLSAGYNEANDER